MTRTTRLGRLLLVQSALDRIRRLVPEHWNEARDVAREFLHIERTDNRRGPDQGRRVRSLVALSIRADGTDCHALTD